LEQDIRVELVRADRLDDRLLRVRALRNDVLRVGAEAVRALEKLVIAVTRSSSWSIRDWLRLTCPRKCFQ